MPNQFDVLRNITIKNQFKEGDDPFLYYIFQVQTPTKRR